MMSNSKERKWEAAKNLIENYFFQLLNGCENRECKNRFCASSGEFNKLTPNQAAARAIMFLVERVPLCNAPLRMSDSSPNCETNINSSPNKDLDTDNDEELEVGINSVAVQDNLVLFSSASCFSSAQVVVDDKSSASSSGIGSLVSVFGIKNKCYYFAVKDLELHEENSRHLDKDIPMKVEEDNLSPKLNEDSTVDEPNESESKISSTKDSSSGENALKLSENKSSIANKNKSLAGAVRSTTVKYFLLFVALIFLAVLPCMYWISL